MAKTENVILTNMCMIYDDDKVLVQDRLDPKWSGITFPGGHVEINESFVDSVVREVYEETGLTVSELQICGTKQWTDINKNYRYIVLFYKTNKFTGELKSSNEGKIFWIKREDLTKYVLADGFIKMLEVFENDNLSENYHWLENGEWMVQNK